MTSLYLHWTTPIDIQFQFLFWAFVTGICILYITGLCWKWPFPQCWIRPSHPGVAMWCLYLHSLPLICWRAAASGTIRTGRDLQRQVCSLPTAVPYVHFLWCLYLCVHFRCFLKSLSDSEIQIASTVSVQHSFRENMISVFSLTVFDWIEHYAPGFKKSIVGKDILAPPDLEKIFGLTGGVWTCNFNPTVVQYCMSVNFRF